MAIIEVVQNDTKPTLTFTVTDDDGDAVDITGASIKFKVRQEGSDTLAIDGTCTVTDASNGVCQYQPVAGDWDNLGWHYGELEVTFSDGTIQTVASQFEFYVRKEY